MLADIKSEVKTGIAAYSIVQGQASVKLDGVYKSDSAEKIDAWYTHGD
jgi:hypothetical protein